MKWIFSALILFFAFPGFSQTVDRTVTLENPDTTGQVSTSQLNDLALQKMAQELTIEYVGAESFNRNKAVLTTRVINQAAKFVPFQKTVDTERGAFGVRMTVQYKVSLSDFRKLLSDAGLFSKTRLANAVISFITIENESGSRLSVSWKPNTNNQEAQNWMREWNDDFKKVFEKAGYTYNKNINPAWLETFSEGASIQDVLNKNSVAQSFILWGTGKITAHPVTGQRTLQVQTKVYSQNYKREVTDSLRRFSLRDDGHPKWENWAQELVAQIDEIDVNSLNPESMMKIVVKGPISLTEQDQFKQLLTTSTSLIKSVSERRFETNGIVYEIQSDSSAADLAQRLKVLEWKGQKMKVDVSSSEIRLEIL